MPLIRKATVEDQKKDLKTKTVSLSQWLKSYAPWPRIALGLGFVCIAFLLSDPVKSAFQAFPGRWAHVLLIAWLVSLCISPLTEILAFRIGVFDIPDRRKIHDQPTPRLGGVAVFLGIWIALAANTIWDSQILVLMICSSVLFVVEIMEDIIGLSAFFRLLVQIVLSIIVVQGGVALAIFPVNMPLGPILNAFITVIWLVGIANAFNFFDGMDGLASGLAILISSFLGAIAFLTDQVHLGWVSIAVLGACLGFLPYNFRHKKPAAIFLGDNGSTVIGYILAGLAVHGEWAVGHPLLNLSPPLLIFGVLIYDMVHTTVARIARGDVRTVRQWIEYTGRDHLHHRFESLLRSKGDAVFMVLLLSFCLGLAALVIRHVSLSLAFVLLLQCLVILALVTILERVGNIHERRRRS